MFLIERLAYFTSSRSRIRKYQQFLEQVKPQANETLLDVGVNDEEYSPTDNYLEKHYEHPENITAVSHESLEHFSRQHPHIKAVIADGTRLPFGDDTFDIVYSNAVIEHVGSSSAQSAFLTELFRVGKRGYLTTPNRHFPIETHTRVPLLHLLLSKNSFDAFLRFIGKDWATGDYMYLLAKTDLTKLLDESGIKHYQILANRFFGCTMTYTVIWHKS
jgi:hypothetical protein